MSPTDERKAAESHRDGGPLQTRGLGNDIPIRKDNDEHYRDGGPLQTRGPGNDIPIRKDNDEHYRDGGPLQTRDATTAPSPKEDDAQTNSSSFSLDDVERGA